MSITKYLLVYITEYICRLLLGPPTGFETLGLESRFLIPNIYSEAFAASLLRLLLLLQVKLLLLLLLMQLQLLLLLLLM